MSRTVHCIKLDNDAQGLARPPLPGELGQRIFEQVSQQAWDQWLVEQARLINENYLDLANPESREFLLAQVERYFFGDGRATGADDIAPE